MRRAAKIDGTQTEIVEALRAAGCKVLSLAACGKGVPDLLALECRSEHPMHWQLYLLEVKNPAGRGNKLTPNQVKFHAEWPVTVVTTPEEALAAVGIHPSTCSRCGGAGSLVAVDTACGPDAAEFDVDCPKCQGTGAIESVGFRK